jgi:hypothetical protein
VLPHPTPIARGRQAAPLAAPATPRTGPAPFASLPPDIARLVDRFLGKWAGWLPPPYLGAGRSQRRLDDDAISTSDYDALIAQHRQRAEAGLVRYRLTNSRWSVAWHLALWQAWIARRDALAAADGREARKC